MLLSLSSPLNLLPVPSKHNTSLRGVRRASLVGFIIDHADGWSTLRPRDLVALPFESARARKCCPSGDK